MNQDNVVGNLTTERHLVALHLTVKIYNYLFLQFIRFSGLGTSSVWVFSLDFHVVWARRGPRWTCWGWIEAFAYKSMHATYANNGRRWPYVSRSFAQFLSFQTRVYGYIFIRDENESFHKHPSTDTVRNPWTWTLRPVSYPYTCTSTRSHTHTINLCACATVVDTTKPTVVRFLLSDRQILKRTAQFSLGLRNGRRKNNNNTSGGRFAVETQTNEFLQTRFFNITVMHRMPISPGRGKAENTRSPTLLKCKF
jgi:hypothetical protein